MVGRRLITIANAPRECPTCSARDAMSSAPRLFVAVGCVLLVISLLVPWAQGYGPADPGRLSPVERPVIPGVIDSVYVIIAAIALALASLMIHGALARASLAAGVFLAAVPWLWITAFLIDPSAFGGKALPGSGFVTAPGFWLVAGGLVALVVALGLGSTTRFGSTRYLPARGNPSNQTR
jgi:hypothetical protein